MKEWEDEEEKVLLSEEKLKSYLKLLCLVLLLLLILILKVCFNFLSEEVFLVLVFLCFGIGRVLLVKCSPWEVETSEPSEEEG